MRVVVRAARDDGAKMNFFADGEAPGGIGEPVTALMAATNANAVANIAGKRPRRLPRIM